MMLLAHSFFAGPTVPVARQLLGARLVRLENGARLAGYIIEAEAYVGEADLGCHAKAGRTPRTQVMYGPPGHAYVYFTYGKHWMLNIVTEAEGFPAAVLLRAVFPSEGISHMLQHRPLPANQKRDRWLDGPARVCQAFGIDRSFHGQDLCAPDSNLWIETGVSVSDSSVTIGPRVGLYSVPEPWKSIPWRFRIEPAALAVELRRVCLLD